MHKCFSFLGLLLIALGGCATQGQYGNLIPADVGGNQVQLASESAVQLETLYPPAKTHFVLQQETKDDFGKTLVVRLREAGYGVREFDQAATAPQEPSELEKLTKPQPITELPLAYLLDAVNDSNLYRLSLLLGSQNLSRLYRVDNGRFVPVGNLVRKKE